MIDLDTRNFRSPLVRRSPDPRRISTRRIGRRLSLVVATVGIAMFLHAALHAGWISSNGPGWIICQLHDQVYLPLVGYTFALFFPLSWSWWVATAVLLFMAIFLILGWLHDRWLVLMLRLGMTYPLVRRAVLLWARLKSTPLRPRLVERVAAQRYRRALRYLDAGCLDTGSLDDPDAARENAAGDLSRLGELRARLVLISPVRDAERLELAAELLAGLGRLELRNAATNIDTSEIDTVLRKLLHELLEPWTAHNEELFSPGALASDIRALIDLASGREQAAWRTALDRLQRRRRDLDARRRELEVRRHLQRPGFRTTARRKPAAPSADERRPFKFRLPKRPVAKENVALQIGRLAFETALFAATRCQDPALALAYVESIEALRFSVQATPGLRDDEDEVRLARDLCGTWPDVDDHRLCARLLEHRRRGATDVTEAVHRHSEIVDADVVRLMAQPIEHLATAAETDP